MRLGLAPAKEDPEDVEAEGEDPITAAEAVIKTGTKESIFEKTYFLKISPPACR